MKRAAAAVMILAAILAAHGSETRATRTRATRTAKAHGPESRATHAQAARKALFEDSELDVARAEAQAALRQSPKNVEALFVEMEAAALEADTGAEIEAALRLCELRGARQRDARVMIAAARLLDLGANTLQFRGAIPRIETLLAHSHPVSPPRCASGQAPPGETRVGQPHAQANYLRAALLAAAADGAPGIAMQQVARESGLLTEWRVAGPFGRYANLDFDHPWAPEQDELANAQSDGHAVERVQFDDGRFRLPEYFARDGVFYAAVETSTAALSRWLVRVESPGTLEVLVDGARVLRKDDRLQVNPEIAWRGLRLPAGRHRVLIKFLASALPFRVALLPTSAKSGMWGTRAGIVYGPEAAYVEAAQKYWEGDYRGAIAGLRGAHAAVADYLLYQAWEHEAEDAPEAAVMLNGALKAAPAALAAEYGLAARAYAAQRTEEALSRLQKVLAARPEFAPAEGLMADIAIRMHWPFEATKALELHIRLHPDCAAIRQAQRFFAAHARYERAQELDKDLELCEPDSLAYARSLSEAGRHQQAAAAAQKVVTARPLHREARELLVRELVFSGATGQAAEAARELAALAPNSTPYRQMAQAAARNPDELLDEARVNPLNQKRLGWGARSEFAQPTAFYSPYRRDGVRMVRQTAERRFSGGPAVMLVNDRVVRLAADGGVSVYVHKLTRVLDRDGIERYGEVELPRGAEVLELRTIKADGTVVEPEFTEQKASVSMPALAPGDAIEQEYVRPYAGGGLAAHAQAFHHTFGSTKAPILYSRFVAITPAADGRVRVEIAGEVPPARTEIRGGVVPTSAPSTSLRAGSTGQTWGALTRVWEKNDIAQSTEEVASARGDILPTVRLEPVLRAGWREVRDRYRNQLIDATRAGERVQEMADRVRGQEPQARARAIYHMLASAVRPTGFALDDFPAAEKALASHAGSRTTALLAGARAAGLDADLLLARDAGTVICSHICPFDFAQGRLHRAEVGRLHPDQQDVPPGLDVYTQPLARFRFDDGHGGVTETVVDAEADGLAFGALPPTVERQDALLVSLPNQAQMQAEPTSAPSTSLRAGSTGQMLGASASASTAADAAPIIALPGMAGSDESVARAEVALDRDGNLSAEITIVLGAWRAAQMRSILAGLEPGQQPHFFQQLAARIFPGAEDVSGETRHQHDTDQALEIVLHCRSPHFANLAQPAADIDQLAPALGLKKMYVGGGARSFPLYIDTPLFETASFRLRLPPGLVALRPADKVEVQNQFGSYSLRFRQLSPQELEITRSFNIPVQVVPPERFAEFARFAAKIDDAERQRITVGSGL